MSKLIKFWDWLGESPWIYWIILGAAVGVLLAVLT